MNKSTAQFAGVSWFLNIIFQFLTKKHVKMHSNKICLESLTDVFLCVCVREITIAYKHIHPIVYKHEVIITNDNRALATLTICSYRELQTLVKYIRIFDISTFFFSPFDTTIHTQSILEIVLVSIFH